MRRKNSARRLLIAATTTLVVAAAALTSTTASAFPGGTGSAPFAGYGGHWRDAYQKAVAVKVLKGVFEDGNTEVVDRYIREDYIQHNPVAPNGTEALKNLAAGLVEQFPDAEYDVERVLSDGDLVLVHSNVRLTPGTPGMAVSDIFRFQGGKIAEHWDSGQQVPENSVSGNDMFSQLTPPRPWGLGPASTEESREVVIAYVERLAEQDVTAVDDYVADDYIQHNPDFPSGAEQLRNGLADFFEQVPQARYDVKRVIADGELVAVHAHLTNGPDDLGTAVVDLYLVRDGRIQEHWDTLQPVPAESANDNTMF